VEKVTFLKPLDASKGVASISDLRGAKLKRKKIRRAKLTK
jgi:hypothetical protein